MIDVKRLDPTEEDDTYVIDFFDPEEKTGKCVSLTQDEYRALVDSFNTHGEPPLMVEPVNAWQEPTDFDLHLVEDLETSEAQLNKLHNELFEKQLEVDRWREQADRALTISERLAEALAF